MKHTLTFIGILFLNVMSGQNLYPEKYQNCILSRFCLDCSEIKAEPPHNFVKKFLNELNQKALNKISGTIEVQILIDSNGNPCLLSAENKSNIKSKKLKLEKGINHAGNWSPAISNHKRESVSVSLILIFKNGQLSIYRREFNSGNRSNMRSAGIPDIKNSRKTKLSDSWTTYNQRNSDLPWDMSRAAVVDKEGVIWIGTDNGLVRIIDEEMKVFNAHNSGLKAKMYDKHKTESIRYAEVDNENNKWLIAGWDAYRFDGTTWTLFDSLNSPINWARKMYADNFNNIWFTSWKGVSKFNGKEWTTINTSNSKLPSNKALGIFVDSKERIWIGTFEGNIRIEGKDTLEFNNSDSPLKDGFISNMHEDKEENLWFSLYNGDDKSKAGIFVLRPNGSWESIKPKNSNLFTKNDINSFLLDEDENVLWIALNSIGLIRFDIDQDKWETYTNQNSEVPSIHVMQMAKDNEGVIWGATFGGIIKLNKL